MKTLLLASMILILGTNNKVEDPWFIDAPGGWAPHCTTGLDMIRQDVKPNCYWGKSTMVHKPTQDQFKCIDQKKARKLQKCATDPYFSPVLGLH